RLDPSPRREELADPLRILRVEPRKPGVSVYRVAAERHPLLRASVSAVSRLRGGHRLHGPRPLGVGHVVAVAGVLAVDHGDRVPAAVEQLATGGSEAGARQRAALRLEVGILAAGEGLDLLRDTHATPVVAAHRAEVGVDLEVLVVQSASGLAVERE